MLILCGIGLPFPEEVILVAAGYTSYRGFAGPIDICAVCALAILCGDSAPFMLGRIFGPKLLRLRLVRKWISTERLALFDSWLDKYGRLTIFIARFLTGIRVPAFFAAGSMRMSIPRFLLMDGLGVLISVPAFWALGHFGGEKVDVVIEWVKTLERGILILVLVGSLVAVGLYFWFRQRQKRKLLGQEVLETFVEGPDTSDPTGAESSTPTDAPGSPNGVGSRGPEPDSSPEATPQPPAPTAETPKEPEDASTSVEPPSGHG